MPINTHCGLSDHSANVCVCVCVCVGVCACVCVFMHLVTVLNKAGRLTGHIASNQKSDRESERAKVGEDLALNGGLIH